MNHFCHLCGKLVDLIGLQPEGVNLCDCKTRASRDNRRLAEQDAEIAALREVVRWQNLPILAREMSPVATEARKRALKEQP